VSLLTRERVRCIRFDGRREAPDRIADGNPRPMAWALRVRAIDKAHLPTSEASWSSEASGYALV